MPEEQLGLSEAPSRVPSIWVQGCWNGGADHDRISYLKFMWHHGRSWFVCFFSNSQASFLTSSRAFKRASRGWEKGTSGSNIPPASVKGGGPPRRSSKGVSLNFPGVFCTWNKAKGRRAVQSFLPVSKANLVKISFNVLFICSTCPELWGL